jgi:hypothetical protein
MPGVTSGQAKLLPQAALDQKAAVDADWIASQTSLLITSLGWIFGGPPLFTKYSLAEILRLPALTAVKGYLAYYNIHMSVLATILASIDKSSSIADDIRDLRQNLDSYVATATSFATKARSFPASPWSAIPQAPAFVALLFAGQLARDDHFVREWNTYLDVYQVLAENALEVARQLGKEGDQIVSDTPAKLSELRNAIDAVKTTSNVDVVLKHEYSSRIDYIQAWTVGETLREACSAVRDVAFELEKGAVAQARRASRL